MLPKKRKFTASEYENFGATSAAAASAAAAAAGNGNGDSGGGNGQEADTSAVAPTEGAVDLSRPRTERGRSSSGRASAEDVRAAASAAVPASPPREHDPQPAVQIRRLSHTDTNPQHGYQAQQQEQDPYFKYHQQQQQHLSRQHSPYYARRDSSAAAAATRSPHPQHPHHQLPPHHQHLPPSAREVSFEVKML